MVQKSGKLQRVVEAILRHETTLIADFYVIGSPARKGNNRINTGNRSIKGIEAQEYSKLFNKQVSRFIPIFNKELPLTRSEYFWVFDLWYKNTLSDVSIELIFDLLQKNKIVINDNKIRNYMCFGNHFDKEFPRIRIRVYGE